MNAEIVAVGTEILLGDIVNTNAQFLANELAALGIGLYYQTVVGDNPQRMRETFETAFKRADIVITTGGLGPTEDDITKDIGAQCFGKELVVDERALKRIEKFFKSIGREMTKNNVKQAYVPEGSIVLYNDNGTAPGIIVEGRIDGNEKILVMLPGPPRETVPMFKEQVRPYLEKKQEFTMVSRVLRVAEVGESAMEMKVIDIIEAQDNPTIAPYAKDNESLLRITARAHSRQEAEEIIEPVAQRIYDRLNDAIYAEGETTIQETVDKILLEKGLTIAVSESCTGGLLAAEIIEMPGISKNFMEGAVTYSNKAKMKRLGVKKETLEKFGAVSAETAIEMARGIAETAGTDIGVSTTGIAGPDGGTPEKPVGLVYIGICINGEAYAIERRLAGSRQRIRERAVYAALNCLRLALLKL